MFHISKYVCKLNSKTAPIKTAFFKNKIIAF